MSIWPLIGAMVAAGVAPYIKQMTAYPRRWMRHRMNDGPLRRFLLTPIGYTKKARDEAATKATLEDYHLLAPGPHELGERDSAGRITTPAERL